MKQAGCSLVKREMIGIKAERCYKMIKIWLMKNVKFSLDNTILNISLLFSLRIKTQQKICLESNNLRTNENDRLHPLKTLKE